MQGLNFAGYERGYFYIRISMDTKIHAIEGLKAFGYSLVFLEPPFGAPVMLKKR